jgi:hypothetical protein
MYYLRIRWKMIGLNFGDTPKFLIASPAIPFWRIGAVTASTNVQFAGLCLFKRFCYRHPVKNADYVINLPTNGTFTFSCCHLLSMNVKILKKNRSLTTAGEFIC